MIRIPVPERRARLGVRQALAGARAATPVAAAGAVVALHATDPATVFLSIRARMEQVDIAAVEEELYGRRSMLRMLGMRRTMFVVPVEDAPVVQVAAADAVAVQQRRRYASLISAAGLGDGAWLADVAGSTLRALAARGSATGAELSGDEPRLRSTVRTAPGKPYEAAQSITSWVLLLLAAEGQIARGRPQGSWLSTRWTWSLMADWLPHGMPRPPVEVARAELARRWLAAFGPGTYADLKWWTGWPAAHVRQAVAATGAVEVDLGGATGLVLPGDLEPTAAPAPWVALLPALDPTPMGWTGRDWYLGSHAAALFDRTGNIGPSVWCDGRVVGGWAQRADGAVVHRLLEDIGAEAAEAVRAEADRLTDWLAPARVVPRFRTPLERELVD